MFHGDIKPDNCLYEVDLKTGTPTKLVLGDWGGSNRRNYTKTPLYTPNDNISYYNYFDSFTDQAEAKHDVFSLSKTVIETLLSKSINKTFVLARST